MRKTNKFNIQDDGGLGEEPHKDPCLCGNGDSKASKSGCKSLASDPSAVTQKRYSTSTKYLETFCKQVKKNMQNKLVVSQLEMMKWMTKDMRQCIEQKTARPVQELADSALGKMVAFELQVKTWKPSENMG